MDLGAPAHEMLAVDMVVTKEAPRWAMARLFTAATYLSIFEEGDKAEAPTVSATVIFTRRDTGATVHEIGADADDAPLVQHVRRQLEELTVGEFLDRWGIDTAAVGT